MLHFIVKETGLFYRNTAVDVFSKLKKGIIKIAPTDEDGPDLSLKLRNYIVENHFDLNLTQGNLYIS